jgi:hypothetical protein
MPKGIALAEFQKYAKEGECEVMEKLNFYGNPNKYTVLMEENKPHDVQSIEDYSGSILANYFKGQENG